MLTNKVGSY